MINRDKRRLSLQKKSVARLDVNGFIVGARSPRQVTRKPLQGDRQFFVFEVPQGPACRVLAKQPECRYQLPEPHLWAEPSNLVQPMQQTGLNVSYNHVLSPILGF